MGSELMRIAEGFSIVAEGLRGLAKAEGGTKDKVVKAQNRQWRVSYFSRREMAACISGGLLWIFSFWQGAVQTVFQKW